MIHRRAAFGARLWGYSSIRQFRAPGCAAKLKRAVPPQWRAISVSTPMLHRVDKRDAVAILRGPRAWSRTRFRVGQSWDQLVDGIWPRAILPAPCFGPMRP